MGWTIKPQDNGVKDEGDSGTTTFKFDVIYQGDNAKVFDAVDLDFKLRNMTTDKADGVTFGTGTVTDGRTFDQQNFDAYSEVYINIPLGYVPGTPIFTLEVKVSGDANAEHHELFALDLEAAEWWGGGALRYQKETPAVSGYGAITNDDIGGDEPEKPANTWPGFEKLSEKDQQGILDQFGRQGIARDGSVDRADDSDDQTEERGAPKSLAPTSPSDEDSFDFLEIPDYEGSVFGEVIEAPAQQDIAPEWNATEDDYTFRDTPEIDPWFDA